ncbi:polysaccharide deacetylase [Geomicrobium sp. JSM 1781026]|uniref:polysaccharide deacetylase family protein n=1 Tax=Geomicrobium sp. JSM 1781026 TaxID=3344580 RepID=UPI0035C1F1F8
MSGNICLTFDFDAISLWLQKDMTSMSSISRGEFGAEAVPRFLHTLKKRNLKSTWFIPGHTMETYPKICLDIHDDGHEIGLHGYDHENFNLLDDQEELDILDRSFHVASNLMGKSPKGFRSPSWDVSSRTIKNIESLGLIYDSSQMGKDYSPYYSRSQDQFPKQKPPIFGDQTTIIEIPVSWSLDDYPYLEFSKGASGFIPGLKKPEYMYDNWLDDASYMSRDFKNGNMVITLHPQVSGRGHRLLAFERWLDTLIERGFTFTTMEEIALRFSQGEKFGSYEPE